MTEEWRLLDPGPLAAWEQMALDAVVIRHQALGQSPKTFRFMQFSPHTALVGYHQSVDRELHRDVCRALGVEVNRRITGGGAIYMDSRQLGWEFCFRQEDGVAAVDADAVYQQLSQVVIRALLEWGIQAQFRPVNDVEVDGRKISGTGGTAWDRALIYQGTLLVDFDVKTMLRVLKLPIEKLTDKAVQSFQDRMVTMAELLGEPPAVSDVKAALIEAVEAVLGVHLRAESLTFAEEQEWEAIKDTYRQPEWIDRRRPPAGDYELREASWKAPGGLLRAALHMDDRQNRIVRAFLTGDFFVYPERAVLDLEAVLKDASASREALAERIRHHYASGPQYLGVSERDWLTLLMSAVDGKAPAV